MHRTNNATVITTAEKEVGIAAHRFLKNVSVLPCNVCIEGVYPVLCKLSRSLSCQFSISC